MAKDGMMAAEREREGKRGKERKKEGGGMKESTLLQFVLYKSEVVFLGGRLTIFPHGLSNLL